MSGHSKWAQIKRQKGVADAKRGQLFTKVVREIMVAVRQGGPSPEGNVRLRLAIQKAKDGNMPVDNIERAIKRASGKGEGAAQLEEITYEGYGPGGVAIMLQALTDNRNRTTSEVRNTFARNGGNMGESGCVSWLFESRGILALETDKAAAEELALLAIDAGAEDVKVDGSTLEVYTGPQDLERVRRALEAKGVGVQSAEIAMAPKSLAPVDPRAAEASLRLLDKLEELDDVQKVYTNADFPEDVLERYRSAA